MMRIAVAVLLAIFAAFAGPSRGSASERVALVIGNAAYERAGWSLRNPVNDARAIAAALGEFGFAVTMIEDATRDEMAASVRQFRRDLVKAVSAHGDQAAGFVYYAGHGLQDHAGVNWLPGVDLEADVLQDVPGQALRLGTLVDQMLQAGAATNFIIVNACRDVPLQQAYLSGQAGRGMARERADRILIAYGAQPGATARDWVEEGDAVSPFAAALLDAFRTDARAYDVIADAAAATVARTNGGQRPVLEYTPTPDDRIRAFRFMRERPVRPRAETPAPAPAAPVEGPAQPGGGVAITPRPGATVVTPAPAVGPGDLWTEERALRSATCRRTSRAVLMRGLCSVSAIAWSPDGRRLAVAGREANVQVWDTQTFADPLVLNGHRETVADAAWRPDSQALATSSYDNTVRIWDLSRPATPQVLAGHGNWVYAVDWSPGGDRLVTGGMDKSVRIWNARAGGAPVVLQHRRAVADVAWSPGGERIAAAVWDKSAWLWDARGAGSPAALPGHTAAVHSVSWSPEGSRLASGGNDNRIMIYDMRGGPPMVLEGHRSTVRGVAWSPDGARIASASADKTVRIWDAAGRRQPFEIALGDNALNVVAWSPDGRRVAIGGGGPEIAIWRLQE